MGLWNWRPCLQSSPSSFDPYGDPWGTVTPVRPTDMPGVLLALQPGAVSPAPHPGSQSPSWAIPLPGLGEAATSGTKAGLLSLGTGRHSSESTEWGPGDKIGPRAKVMEHGHRLDPRGCLGHRVPGQAESSLTLLLCYPSLTTGGLELRMTNKRKGVDTCP